MNITNNANVKVDSGYAFANTVLESVKIPEVKQRINKLIANKLGVNIGFDL